MYPVALQLHPRSLMALAMEHPAYLFMGFR
jgi:hypothetical protein